MITLGTNAYIDLATFKAWCDLRNRPYACKSDNEIEAAIVRASLDFIDVNYTFKGDKVDSNQEMQLPTDKVAIADIKNGAAEAAWQALNDELFVSVTAQSAGQITKERKKLDVMEKEIEYAEGTGSTYTHSTSQISRFLSPFTTTGYGMSAQRVI